MEDTIDPKKAEDCRWSDLDPDSLFHVHYCNVMRNTPGNIPICGL